MNLGVPMDLGGGPNEFGGGPMDLGGVPINLGGVLTEHGVQAHQAADEVVEIQVPPFVPIAAPQDPPELGGQPEPCRK